MTTSATGQFAEPVLRPLRLRPRPGGPDGADRLALTPLGIALLVIYPLFDVAAAVIDFRSSGTARPRVPLYVNMALSLFAAAGLAVAVTSGIPVVPRVWGVWAITAGVVQLIVAILRRRLGGQWAMILSGGISAVAGASFILQAGGRNASLVNVAGYATLGGVFFLISAIRLHRSAVEAHVPSQWTTR